MAHFHFVISQNAIWGHAGFYIDCHRMTVPENILLQKALIVTFPWYLSSVLFTFAEYSFYFVYYYLPYLDGLGDRGEADTTAHFSSTFLCLRHFVRTIFLFYC